MKYQENIFQFIVDRKMFSYIIKVEREPSLLDSKGIVNDAKH